MPTFNLFFIFGMLRKYLWYILGVVGLSTAAAIVFSAPYFYPPQFASTAIVYPTNNERYDINNLLKDQQEVYIYGGPKEAEKIINYATSEKVALFVIDSLNLWGAYGIDKQGTSPKFYALEQFRDNLDVKKAEGSGVEITAFDTDPQRAAAVVSVIIHKVNLLNKAFLDKQREEIIRANEALSQQLQVLYLNYQDSAMQLRKKYNVFSYREQTDAMINNILTAEAKYADAKAKVEVFEKQYAATDTQVVYNKARMKGAENQLKSIKDPNSLVSLPKFQEGVDKLMLLEQWAIDAQLRIAGINHKIKTLKLLQDMTAETIIVHQEPEVSDRKARPVRSLIILTTFIIALVSVVGGLILIELIVPFLKNK